MGKIGNFGLSLLIFLLATTSSGCATLVSERFINTRANFITNEFFAPITWNHYPILIWIDQDISVAQANETIRAIEQWNSIARFEIFTYEFGTYDDAVANGNVFLSVRHLEPITENEITLGLTSRFFIKTNGIATGIHHCLVDITDNLNLDFWYPVVLHELGHVIGFNHDMDRDSIMYRHVLNSNQIITEEDMATVRNLIKFRSTGQASAGHEFIITRQPAPINSNQ